MKQRATMKPIPAWLLVSKKTGEPKSASGDVALALIYFDEKVARKSRYSSERVVAVEIRERPKPRRVAKTLTLKQARESALKVGADAEAGIRRDRLEESRRPAGKGMTELKVGQTWKPLSAHILTRTITVVMFGAVRYETWNGLRWMVSDCCCPTMVRWIKTNRAVLIEAKPRRAAGKGRK